MNALTTILSQQFDLALRAIDKSLEWPELTKELEEIARQEDKVVGLGIYCSKLGGTFIGVDWTILAGGKPVGVYSFFPVEFKEEDGKEIVVCKGEVRYGLTSEEKFIYSLKK